MASKTPSPKTIIFKSDQHAAIISEKLQNFYEQNEFFDTVLIAGSNSVAIQAHRDVLCALSEYFLEIFRGDQSALKGNKVELKEIDASTLKLIIDFMYSGSIELSVETVGIILRAASFLKIKSLVDGCCKTIEENIDSSNCFSWFRLGNELYLPNLKTSAEEYIYTQFEEISKEAELLMLSENELKDLLFNDNPYGDFEEDVFLAMVAWLNFDKLNRKHLVLQLLSMVHFQALTPKFIVENRKSVCETVESYELICSWLQWHLSPETRSDNQDQHDCSLKPREKKKKKLAVIRTCSEKFHIETFNPNENVWSAEKETHILPINVKANILIDDKLIFVCYDEVKCIDLHTSEWIDLPSMKQTLNIKQIADLKGNLCVLGCDVNDDSVSMKIYNFSTSKWYDVKPLAKPSLKVRLATHNDMLYLLDFEAGCLQSYNVSSNEWTLKQIKKDSLRYYGFAAVEGFLYIIGGYCCATREWVNTVDNLSNDSWCEVASLQRAIPNLGSTVFENKIIVYNHSENALEYNPDFETWHTLGAFDSNKKKYFTLSICHLTAKN